ncbi:DUF58 domain-containing protein [Methylococcus capsulatus]|uniref:DUF58 domain-containing protein n=1 Tax=Methylococcus capsulatus TaxID=414 RepID=UPI001C5319D0|nr:hypothetical protein [Methylococcus capsulatus]QXP88440.1 hypothetical protein KW112_04735 [Methylococcus capsulatus]QXP94543.1 hypothetical protein KW113_04985 [Methylococcus capsulatus]UQN13485.1 hypothetical protein M3M30_06460 [Methylococcus capsulatus]
MKHKEFHYRLTWRADGVQPGAHPSRQGGGVHAFQRLVPFQAHPDPRRLHLRASLGDPGGHFWVRLHEQRGRIAVYALADLSASMGYRGRASKTAVLADFTEGLALSSYRTGDVMGFVGLSDRSVPDFHLPPTRQVGAALMLAERLRGFRPTGGSARGLLHAVRYLPSRRGLVFLQSDFHFPLGFLKQVMESLAHHDVVPVVLWDPEESVPEASGLARMQDMENGMERLMWLRPALRARLSQTFQERRERLAAMLRGFGREPLFLSGGFDPDAVTRYFHAG